MESDDVITVGELDRRLRRAVEVASDDFWIEGEVALSPTIYNSHIAESAKKGAPLAWFSPRDHGRGSCSAAPPPPP